MNWLAVFTIPQAPLQSDLVLLLVGSSGANSQAGVEERVADIVELVTLSNRTRRTLGKSMVLSPVQVRMARKSWCSNGSKA